MPFWRASPGYLALLFLWLHPGCSNTVQRQASDSPYLFDSGAVVRGDTTTKAIALVFTGHEFADGGEHIIQVLRKHHINASFFLTGKFYRQPEFHSLTQKLVKEGHYLGAHSDQHLLYCDWQNRDSLLISKEEFRQDLLKNYQAMEAFGIQFKDAPLYLPPYEWYNDSIASWTRSQGLQLINLTYGTLSHADYTLPSDPAYRNSKTIYKSILDYEVSSTNGLNGFILLSHIGTSPKRSDKFHLYLGELIEELTRRGYEFIRIDQLLPFAI